jgi:hypothetical protein
LSKRFPKFALESPQKWTSTLEHNGKIVAGRNAVTDGPFAESKEAIAGFFVIQADGLEQAVEIAKSCPGLDYGQTVEVRAIAAELQVAPQKMAG